MSVNKATAAAIEAVGGDPTDHTWEWLALYGPHGERFTWSQTRSQPPGYVSVEHLEETFVERERQDPGYRARVLGVARKALSSTDSGLLLRAVQIAAVLGGGDELRTISALKAHPDLGVAANAKAGAFYLKQKLRSSGESE
ncbi:MAG TPA: hypothetical protein VEC19_02610 [Usitatibacter sp.]|nr:hypothetical protein [Usitatibacter sp.]